MIAEATVRQFEFSRLSLDLFSFPKWRLHQEVEEEDLGHSPKNSPGKTEVRPSGAWHLTHIHHRYHTHQNQMRLREVFSSKSEVLEALILSLILTLVIFLPSKAYFGRKITFTLKTMNKL